MDRKIIPFPQRKKPKKFTMLFLIIALGAISGLISWQYFVENVAKMDVKIPESKNITFNQQVPLAMTTAQIANEFEKADNKPILLYVYTTWCKVCTANFPVINDTIREFQNTDLKVIVLAIDRNLTAEALQAYLNKQGDIYFEPRFLAFKEGFIEFLHKQNIRYDNRIPMTVLISRNGEVVTKFTGAKNKNHLRNKIIREIGV